jgi:hypothetical protein
MTFIRTRRVVATVVVASCMAVPASAAADGLPSTFRTDAAQSGGNGKINSVQPQTGSSVQALAQERYSSSFGTRDKAKSTFPPADFRGGDNPADHPGMSRAPQYDGPTTIEVVRPERTIVRDVDEALPMILSSAALLLVLAGLVVVLIRTRTAPRAGH